MSINTRPQTSAVEAELAILRQRTESRPGVAEVAEVFGRSEALRQQMERARARVSTRPTLSSASRSD